MITGHVNRRRLKRGSTLVAVFWIMSILSLAVFTSVRLLYYEIDLVTAQVQGSRARQMAEMGIAIASNPVVERTDPLLHWEFENGREGFDAKLRSEAERFNINYLLMKQGEEIRDKPLLREIFMSWGAELEQADEVIDALTDWSDEDEFTEINGAEFSYYEDLGFLNRPYNRPFYSLDEMRLVRGMDFIEALNPNWQEWFTVWSSGPLDLNEADPELLSLAVEITVDEAQDLQGIVLGPDLLRDTEDDLPFQSVQEALNLLGLPEVQQALVTPRLTVNDTVARIESVGWAGDIKRRVILILRNRSGRPAVLERREEVVL
jgi:type II secretory pathway component PulK